MSGFSPPSNLSTSGAGVPAVGSTFYGLLGLSLAAGIFLGSSLAIWWVKKELKDPSFVRTLSQQQQKDESEEMSGESSYNTSTVTQSLQRATSRSGRSPDRTRGQSRRRTRDSGEVADEESVEDGKDDRNNDRNNDRHNEINNKNSREERAERSHSSRTKPRDRKLSPTKSQTQRGLAARKRLSTNSKSSNVSSALDSPGALDRSTSGSSKHREIDE
jgi:hypothetical protein